METINRIRCSIDSTRRAYMSAILIHLKSCKVSYLFTHTPMRRTRPQPFTQEKDAREICGWKRRESERQRSVALKNIRTETRLRFPKPVYRELTSWELAQPWYRAFSVSQK